jgi:hypothetical protein
MPMELIVGYCVCYHCDVGGGGGLGGVKRQLVYVTSACDMNVIYVIDLQVSAW